MSDLSATLKKKAEVLAFREGPNVPSTWTQSEIFSYLVTKTKNAAVASAAAKLLRKNVAVIAEAKVTNEIGEDVQYWEEHDAAVRERNMAQLNKGLEEQHGHAHPDNEGDEETGRS